jgi:Transglycosylase SLT domain
VAGHRSPSGRRAQTAVVVRDRAAHRAPSDGQRRVQVVAAAATLGAVAAGTATTFLPGAPAVADMADATPNPMLAASAGVLQPAERIRALTAPSSMLPVAYRYDGDDATEQRVASVQKASRLAEQLAAVHAEQARIQGVIRAGGLDGWIAEALQVMGLPQRLAPGVKKIILAESGGNPHAINTWDSNAVRGTPSRGLMQTIPSTFRTYVHPELADRPITDPVANITAGVRYMIDRYGMETVAAGGRSDGLGSYVGY